jgi:hypothetical protein
MMLPTAMAAGMLILPFVMLVYICVSVVLSWPHSRKEREILYITLDSTVFVFRVKEI